MVFIYRRKVTFCLKWIVLSLCFRSISLWGLKHESEWLPADIPFQVVVHFYTFLFVFSTLGLVMIRSVAKGDRESLYLTRFLLLRKKLSWNDIVSIRFERFGRNDMFLYVKSRNDKSIRMNMSNWNVSRDDVIFDFQKQNPMIRVRY